MSETTATTYGEAICEGFRYLFANYENVFAIGQGLWAPWYVGNSMRALEKEFGTERVIDSPVSEAACTGAALGAALCGYRPIVVHPRMDFMILAIDQIVTQAAKWSHMFGGQAAPGITIRAIFNRGGEQGAQHSQALHSWFAHIPGLRVVMPATVADARDLLIASVLSGDPVLYIDDRWLYDERAILEPVKELRLADQLPQVLRSGDDITLVGIGHSVLLCRQAAETLQTEGIACEVIDLRVLNPLRVATILESAKRTRRLCVVDSAWRSCGMGSELIAGVVESAPPGMLLSPPLRIALPDAPAPTSKALEDEYYITVDRICAAIRANLAASGHTRRSTRKPAA